MDRSRSTLFAVVALASTALSALVPASAQTDPGPRQGPPAAGGPLRGLSASEQNFFAAARSRFMEVNSVSGTAPGAQGRGLGPRFNADSCGACHAQPAIGGSSPASNPQIGIATRYGARNTIPSFITPNGPVREARFIGRPNGAPDGGVHALFVITGRRDAPGCHIAQPDFAQAEAEDNIVFRIPTPVFGLGEVENTPDATLVNDAAAFASLRAVAGISGHFNHSGNDGTITRFGWKAQNKSLLVFSGEAYNVEQGVTNELFPNEREGDPNCQFNTTPEDATNLADPELSNSPASDFASDTVNFASFARLSAGPTPAAPTPSTTRGQIAFTVAGCGLCHVPQHKTAASPFTGQSNVAYAPYSDFELHAMGKGLADEVAQGEAEGDEFRTAPLWGLGQRSFFLHDGRTSDLLEAIEQHASNGSEANAVIRNFNALPQAAKQDLLNFLRSL
jgi:CxxC motif-containing protein (DUF1111 family)